MFLHLFSRFSETLQAKEAWVLLTPSQLASSGAIALCVSASILFPAASRAEFTSTPPEFIPIGEETPPISKTASEETANREDQSSASVSTAVETLADEPPSEPDPLESSAAKLFPAQAQYLEPNNSLSAESAEPALTDAAPPLAPPVLTEEMLQVVQLNGLSNTASKYPWIVNPTDGLTLEPKLFNPLQTRYYHNFKTQFGPDGITLERVMLSDFKPEDQMYRVLPGNRIIFETEGWNVGLIEQGQSLDINIQQLIRRRLSLWGMQAAWAIPQIPTEDRRGLEAATVVSLAGEISNPGGAPVSSSDIQLIVPEAGRSSQGRLGGDRPSNLSEILSTGKASSFNSRGGGALFENLDDDRAPVLLQAFPTNNLQPLFAGISLVEGVTVPEENLTAAGIRWSDPLTGLGGGFAPELTSTPGVRIAKSDRFENQDLLQILVNPSLEPAKRDYHYLNSLHWVSLGEQQPKQIAQVSNTATEDSGDWQRTYLSRSRRQSLLQYSETDVEATFLSRSSNPGLSTSFALEAGDIDLWQTVHATLGLAMGGIFEFLPQASLDQGLAEARDRAGEAFAPLKTAATPAERQQINRRLDQSLENVERSSGLSQLSGSLSLRSRTTPQWSEQLEIRTGLHQRRVQFLDQSIRWDLREPYISKLRIGNEDFGSLTFVGTPLPISNGETGENSVAVEGAIAAEINAADGNRAISPRSLDQQVSNIASKAEVTLTEANGDQFTQQLTSDSLAGYPVGVRQADLTFDRIELSRLDRRNIAVESYRGFLELPSIEAAWAGSRGNFDYGFNLGSWLNLSPDSAPGLQNNVLGEPEPSMGVYLSSAVGHTRNQFQQDEAGKTLSVTTHRPLVRLQLNSAINPDNPAFGSASYTWSKQSRNLQWALVPGLILSNNGEDWQTTSFLQGSLNLKSGLGLQASLEKGEDWFTSLKATQRVSDRWSVGGDVQNFRSSQQVLKGRLNENSAGVSFKYQLPKPGSSLEGRLGFSQAGLELRLEGTLGF